MNWRFWCCEEPSPVRILELPPTVSVIDLAQRWGLDSIEDVMRIVSLITFPASKEMRGSLAYRYTPNRTDRWLLHEVEAWEHQQFIKPLIKAEVKKLTNPRRTK